MIGQMLACPPHFSLLSEALRAQLIDAFDVITMQERRGNVRRDSREHWRTLVGAAMEEWRAIRASIEPHLQPHEDRNYGVMWVRALERARQATEQDRNRPAPEASDA